MTEFIVISYCWEQIRKRLCA